MRPVIVVALLLASVDAWAKPQAVKTQFPTRDVVVAEEMLAPLASVEADAAPAIQTAIDRVAKAGGGTVFLPAGAYTIATRVVVREGVTLRGDHQYPAKGTLLRITADKGAEDAPATFSLERGSGLVGLSFWYPEQRLPDPVPYPWTVKSAVMPANDNQTVEDCSFVNAWNAICIGPEGNELHTFRRLMITALNTGISIDSTTDIGRISEVSLSPDVWADCGLPNVPQADVLRDYLMRHDTVAVDIGRSDWEYMWRLDVRGYRRGVVFRKGLRGTTNAVMADSRLTSCSNALEVVALNQVGFSAYGCAFAGVGQSFEGAESFDAVVQFHSCTFDGALVNRGRGVVTLQSCVARNGGVRADQGQLLAQDSELGSVELGEAVTRARLLDTDVAETVTNLSLCGDVVVSGVRAPRRKATALVAPGRPVMPRPTSDALFVVTDFGASPENPDNAAAFQAALDVAGANEGGGTVYVPGGLYAFRHDIKVPPGVELRGCSDVPHHTISAGSVLMIYHGSGEESGQPFTSLEPRAGLRGLTFWYPEQPLKEPVPYPWTVRALGKACWLRDVTIGNAWQGVDFATHRSDGHCISYLAGSMYRRGLFVGNSKGKGWVEHVQFNPHYAARLPQRLPRVYGDKQGDAGGHIIPFQREHLEGLVFKDCRDEQLCGTFLYAAYDGIAFRGKCHAQVLMHGTDTGSRSASFEMARGSEVDFALAQLVSLGDWAKAAVVTLPGNKGTVRLFNSQFWAGPATAVLEGGTVRMEQFNTLTGPVEVRGGRLEMANGVFDRHLNEHVAVSRSAAADVTGTIFERGPLCVSGDVARVCQRFNSSSTRPSHMPAADAPVRWASSFESGEPDAVRDTVAQRGGGIRKVSGNRCGAMARDDAHGGGRAILFQGLSDDPAYSFVYHVVTGQPLFVMPDTVLTYWHKPLNGQGRATGIDLLFSDGRVLRESGLRDGDGRGVNPGAMKGPVGSWTKIVVPLGKYAGQTIVSVMAAYDSRKGGGAFEALFDDLSIEPDLPAAAWCVRAVPAGGRVSPKTAVSIEKDASVQVRFTLDGSAPELRSTLYAGPVTLPEKGVVELRYAPVKADGSLSKEVFAAVYDVE